MSFFIFSDLKRVIDEVGEDRFYALIAHHEPEFFYKTIEFRFLNRKLRLCTRCTGIYLGIILTIIYLLLSFTIPPTFIPIVIVFPVPAILDWGLEKFDIWKGNNITRFVSGFMLGICYIFLWSIFLRNPLDIMVWSVASVYVIIVCFILYVQEKREIKKNI